MMPTPETTFPEIEKFWTDVKADAVADLKNADPAGKQAINGFLEQMSEAQRELLCAMCAGCIWTGWRQLVGFCRAKHAYVYPLVIEAEDGTASYETPRHSIRRCSVFNTLVAERLAKLAKGGEPGTVLFDDLLR